MTIKEYIRGAAKVGIVRLGPVDDGAISLYGRWIGQGHHGEMNYLEKYSEVRNDPRLLLEGAKSMIVAAFSYNQQPKNNDQKPTTKNQQLRWARYAIGRDYHEEVRQRLTEAADKITADTGAACRVTVDTAPLRERYWAVKAGVGFLGINNQLIVPGYGSRCVLGEIITTLDLEPDRPDTRTCLGCMRCVRSCPGQALDGHGGMDARRCLSYLTIEKRIPSGSDPATARVIMPDGSPAPMADRIYGCDVCQEVCPHNKGVAFSEIENFAPRQEILNLTREDILGMSQEEFSRIFSHSAIKRTKLSGLQRNARTLRDPGATLPE